MCVLPAARSGRHVVTGGASDYWLDGGTGDDDGATGWSVGGGKDGQRRGVGPPNAPANGYVEPRSARARARARTPP